MRGDFDIDEWGRDSFDWDEMLLSEIPWGSENAVSTRELADRLNFTKSTVRKEIDRLIDRGYFIGRNQVGIYQVRQGNERDLRDLSRWARKLKGDGYALLDQAQQLQSIYAKAREEY